MITEISEEKKAELVKNKELRDLLLEWGKLKSKEKKITSEKKEVREKITNLLAQETIEIELKEFGFSMKLNFNIMNIQIYFSKFKSLALSPEESQEIKFKLRIMPIVKGVGYL